MRRSSIYYILQYQHMVCRFKSWSRYTSQLDISLGPVLDYVSVRGACGILPARDFRFQGTSTGTFILPYVQHLSSQMSQEEMNAQAGL